ncbi:MAG: kelch repeat-containing protein [Planctomycetota bacterium]|nr:kelch repeat-containing protein [Planctomycetota bacterium]
MRLRSLCIVFLTSYLWIALSLNASAHFSWLSVDQKDGKPVVKLHFSEAAHVEGAHIPEKVGASELLVWDAAGLKDNVTTEMIETDDGVSREGELPRDIACSVQGTCTYGIYHSFLLTYYPKAIYIKNRSEMPAVSRAANQKFDIVPAWHEYGLEITTLWEGKPQPGVTLSVIGPDEEEKQLETNAKGRVLLTDVAPGLYGFRAHFVSPDSAGEHEGKPYDEEQHFATLTLRIPEDDTSAADASKIFIPNPIASFGAATNDGYLYVYGGHTGRAHSHSRQNLSPHFIRIPLEGETDWENLPMQTHLQGLALVAHGKHLYRVGGLNARNDIDDEADLYSVKDFARYDPTKGTWESLPDMPTPRSSHDAVVVGNKLFVMGGWWLEGDSSDGDWHDTALEIDLSAEEPEWKVIENVPFERRALATAALDGKVYVLCGLTSLAEVSQEVNIYDPKTETWTKGPDFPGEGMHGFGVSAWGSGPHVLATGLDGVVYRLASDQKDWEKVTQLDQGRVFHRVFPAGDRKFAMVGGASMSGHINRVDFFEIDQ